MLVPWSLIGLDSCNFVEISLCQFFSTTVTAQEKKLPVTIHYSNAAFLASLLSCRFLMQPEN